MVKIMSASLQDVTDFDFIISEVGRINKELSSSNLRDFYQKEYNRPLGSIGMTIDTPYELLNKNNSTPRRQIRLSYASSERLYSIAARYIKSNRLEMLVTVDELVEIIKDSLYIHIFIDDAEDGIKGCTRILNNSFKLIKREMVEEDFYFPILAHGLIKDKISIGRAEIIPSKKMYSMIGDALTEDQLTLSTRYCLAHKYPYEHFLIIPISKRSKKSRERIAKNIAAFIVGILHLFSEHYKISPYFLSLSTSPYLTTKAFILQRNQMMISIFEADYCSDLGTALSKLIDLAIEPNERSIISDRLIDAIYLFSSAQQDKDESSRIVKLATALERLVSLPSEKKDSSTTRNFTSLVSSLVSIYYPNEKEWYKVAKEMYEIRSDIAHGTWSLYRGVEALYSSKYSELTSRAIFSACNGFYKLGFTEKNNDKLVKDFFSFIENAIDKNT